VTLLQKFQAWIRPRESSSIDIREQKLHITYSAADKVETRWPQQHVTITDAKQKKNCSSAKNPKFLNLHLHIFQQLATWLMQLELQSVKKKGFVFTMWCLKEAVSAKVLTDNKVCYAEENSLSLSHPALNPDLRNYPGSQRKLEPGIHHASTEGSRCISYSGRCIWMHLASY
jgi:hypothetical protein